MMNSEQVISLYESMSELTGKMLVAARSCDWENLVELEHHCAGHVQSLKAGESVAALSGEKRARKVAIIHQILAHDREIREITEPWMAQLSDLINNTGSQRRLSAAYGPGHAA